MTKAPKNPDQMNMLLKPPVAGPITMSSREIAVLCEKEHKHVIRDIEKMLADIFGDGPNLDHLGVTRTYDARGYVSEYTLPKDLTVTLITGYRADLRYKVVRRLEELESARRRPVAPAAIPDLSNPRVLLQLLTEHTAKLVEADERVATAEAQVEAARPAVEFYGRFVNADGLYGLQNAARALNQRPNKFVGWLKQSYLFYQGGELVPRAVYRERGIFEVKATMIDEKAHYRTFVTPKGLRYLAKKLGVEAPEI